MKKSLYFAIASLALVGCSDEFLGEGQGTGVKENLDNAIMFKSSFKGLTRADHAGADAAMLLGSRFVVEGTKGANSVATTTVFDNYNVIYGANTAGTTESNTADWEYVGQFVHKYAGDRNISMQSIKYWDYSQAQYDFIAYSTGTTDFAKIKYAVNPAADEIYVSDINPSTATNAASGGAYKVQGTKDVLKNFYIADLVTVPKANYGEEVQIRFRNLASKVRLAFYETVPGYSVRDVEFYESVTADIRYVPTTDVLTAGDDISSYFKSDGTSYGASDVYVDDSTTPCFVPEADVTNIATLFTSGDINNAGTYTVYYPTVNDATPTSDKNKAHVTFTPDASGTSTTTDYAALDYVRDQASTLEAGGKYLGTTSATATYAGSTAEKTYYTVLPNETAFALTLRVNYTLVSDDGSGETIKVWGAKAVVPAEYCQWKSNFAYTYIFKISDNTNGATEGLGGTVEGLRPITFDAVVTEVEDGNQETITTVATPSITTYMPGVNATIDNEYPAGTIYVMVNEDGTNKTDLNTKGKLYKVTGETALVPATEANVMDALNIRTSTGTGTPVVITGRNNLVLTEATADATITAIPRVDGNNVTVAAGEAASFAATTGTYAYVYEVSDAADETFNTAVNVATEPTGWPTGYYTDFACTVSAPATFAAGLYYTKITNNKTTYAVKVIKVQ